MEKNSMEIIDKINEMIDQSLARLTEREQEINSMITHLVNNSSPKELIDEFLQYRDKVYLNMKKVLELKKITS